MRLHSAIALLGAFFLLSASAVPAADHVFVYPSASVNLVQVLDAANLAPVGTIDAPQTAFTVLRTIDGSKYYVVSRRAERSVVVVDAASLLPTGVIDLGVSPSSAVLSPDGRYLLLVGSGLHVVDTATDTLGPTIDVGGQPTQVIVDDASTTAFVLAARGARVSVVDLSTLTERDSIQNFDNGGSIALSNDGARLLIAYRGGLAQFRVGNLEPIEAIPGNFILINPAIHLLPGGRKVVVQSRGVAPSNTSQVFDLDTGVVRNIGSVGITELEDMVFVDSTRGYAIDTDLDQVVEIDLTATPDPTVTPLAFGNNPRALDLSPNGTELFVTSLVDATATRVDTRNNTISKQVSLPIAPGGHTVIYGPSTLPPAHIEVHGGDGQYYPPNVPLPVSLTVRVTDSTGRPLANVPVLFEDPAGAGLQISPEQPSFTNLRGVASVKVTIPPKAPPPPPAEGEEAPEEEPIERLTLQAKTAGLDPVAFIINAIRGAGLIRIAGDYQMTSENTPFPREIVVLATDRTGAPLPRGTVLDLGPSGVGCFPNPMIVGAGGFARTHCNGNQFPTTSSQFFIDAHLTVTASALQPVLRELASTAFRLTVGRAATILTWEKLSGDNQTAPSGTEVPNPLHLRLNVINGFGRPNITRPIHVEVSTVSGPPVFLEPKVLRVHPGTTGAKVDVRLGPNAGTTVLKFEASSPNLPTTFFTVNATGGSPTRLQISGDNQTGKIASRLPQNLRVQVVNESGEFVPFPQVTWRVISGDASLEVMPDASGSNAVVNFGNNPGPVAIQAAIGSLQHIFSISSVPPEPTSISTFSGQNQTLTTGILSDPLVVSVSEADGSPAAGARVTFTGPANVRLHPVDGSSPGNPVQVIAGLDGRASVRVELIGVSAAFEEGAPVDQISSTVTITANVGGNLATSFLLSVAGRTPVFSADRVQNAASFERGLVPGSLGSIFGSGLMEGVVGFEQPAGATSHNGTTVRVGGVAAPLLLLAAGPPEQINFQAPFELAPGQNTTVEITNNGSTTIVANVPVFRAQPGIFEFQLGSAGMFGAVIHADTGDLVTPDNPAEHGEILSLYATGMGRVNSTVVGTGILGPIPAPHVTLPVIVGVDNAGANILFSGYAPGFLGVYQVNFEVPENIGCGVRSLNMKVGDAISPNTSIAILCN